MGNKAPKVETPEAKARHDFLQGLDLTQGLNEADCTLIHAYFCQPSQAGLENTPPEDWFDIREGGISRTHLEQFFEAHTHVKAAAKKKRTQTATPGETKALKDAFAAFCANMARCRPHLALVPFMNPAEATFF